MVRGPTGYRGSLRTGSWSSDDPVDKPRPKHSRRSGGPPVRAPVYLSTGRPGLLRRRRGWGSDRMSRLELPDVHTTVRPRLDPVGPILPVSRDVQHSRGWGTWERFPTVEVLPVDLLSGRVTRRGGARRGGGLRTGRGTSWACLTQGKGPETHHPHCSHLLDDPGTHTPDPCPLP